MLRPANGVVSIPHELDRIDQSSSPRGDVYRQCTHGQQDEGDADVGRGICGADAEYEAAEEAAQCKRGSQPDKQANEHGAQLFHEDQPGKPATAGAKSRSDRQLALSGTH
jgi:hypothetical protein